MHVFNTMGICIYPDMMGIYMFSDINIMISSGGSRGGQLFISLPGCVSMEFRNRPILKELSHGKIDP